MSKKTAYQTNGKVSIIVPSTINLTTPNGEKWTLPAPAEAIERLKTLVFSQFTELFGGASGVTIFGQWRDVHTNALIEENGTLIYAYVSRGKLTDNEFTAVEALATYIRDILSQDAVMWTFEQLPNSVVRFV